MPEWLLWSLNALWFAWVFQAGFSAWKVRRIGDRLARKRVVPRWGKYRPPVSVIVPFKGLDTDLAAGVRGLFEQDYPRYRLFLVVESADDPACEVLRRELAARPEREAELLIAGPAGPSQGQKIHNQLCALDRLWSTSPDSEVWVFADSDAVPGPQWLARLIEPLNQADKTAVTTGYRWLIPAEPDTLWSHLASVINSSIACMYGRDEFNHAWGGSMAVRADAARQGDLRGLFQGAICDDYQMTRLSRNLGLRVYFVKQCLVATPVRFTWATLLNFGHRQYLLTRVYQPALYALGLSFVTLYLAGLISAWSALLYGLAFETGRLAWLWAAAALLGVGVCNQIRASLRKRVVRLAFGDEGLAKLRKTLHYDRWATPLWMAVNWVLIMRAAFGRTMVWRGIRYRVRAPQRIERLSEPALAGGPSSGGEQPAATR